MPINMSNSWREYGPVEAERQYEIDPETGEEYEVDGYGERIEEGDDPSPCPFCGRVGPCPCDEF